VSIVGAGPGVEGRPPGIIQHAGLFTARLARPGEGGLLVPSHHGLVPPGVQVDGGLH